MIKEIRPAVVMLLALAVLTGVAYPLAMTGISSILFPRQAAGSIIERDGKGGRIRTDRSALFGGQVFSWPPVGHARARSDRCQQDGARSLQCSKFRGLEFRAYEQRAKRSDQRRSEKLKGRIRRQPTPVDLVTTSGSGLDPHISPEAALFQLPRIAKARNMPEDRSSAHRQGGRGTSGRSARRAARERSCPESGARRQTGVGGFGDGDPTP